MSSCQLPSASPAPPLGGPIETLSDTPFKADPLVSPERETCPKSLPSPDPASQHFPSQGDDKNRTGSSWEQLAAA